MESLSLEEQYRAMAEVEVYEVFRLCVSSAEIPLTMLGVLAVTMRDEASEVSSYNAMPCRSCS